MKLALELLFMLATLWSAHLAGIHMALASDSPKHKRAALTRSALSVIAAVLVIFISLRPQ
jgi:hypothetical protein